MARFSNWRVPLIGTALSIVFVALVLTRVDLRGAWAALQRIEPQLIWLPILLGVLGLSLRAWRWQIIFPPAVRPDLKSCLSVWLIGNMANNVLPARGGEVLRCFAIARGRAAGASTALATLGLEKVLDGFALLAVVGLSFAFFEPPVWLTRASLLAGLVFGGALAAMIALHARPDVARNLVCAACRKLRLPAPGRKLGNLVDRCAEGLAAVRSVRHMLILILLTSLAWLAEVAVVWAMARAMHVPISIWSGAAVTAVVGLGLMVPSAPGYLGTYEFFAVASLGLVGVPAESALALTLVLHACVLVVTTGLGLGALLATGLSFSRVRALQRQAEA